MSEPFLAEIRMFAGNFAPRGWALCDGQLLPIAQNTALFSLIGTIYGGDGRTTFALPDLRARAPMHPGNGPGLTPRRLGQTLGEETVVLNVSQLPSHTHQMNVENNLGDVDTPTNHSLAPAGYQTDSTSNLVHMNTAAIADTGGGQGHDNMAPSLGINFIIAVMGLFPSRS